MEVSQTNSMHLLLRVANGAESTEDVSEPLLPLFRTVQHFLQGLQLFLGRSLVFHLISYVADTYICHISYSIIHNICIPILLGMEIHPQILFWHNTQDWFSHVGLYPTFTVHVLAV